MKEIIKTVSQIFNRGYVLGKCAGDGGIVGKHDLQAALKEEIENAAKVFSVTQQAVPPDAENNGVLNVKRLLELAPEIFRKTFYPRR